MPRLRRGDGRRGRMRPAAALRGLRRARAVLLEGARLLGLDLRQKLERALMFRLNFVIHAGIALGYSFAFSVLQFFIYASMHGYPGWDPEQMLLFQATLLL